VAVLKNQVSANGSQSRSAWFRKTLTVSQFIIAQFFIIATIVVGRQIDFSINMDMGFSKDNIVTVKIPMNYFKPDDKAEVLSNELKSIPGVSKISKGDAPAISGSMTTVFKFEKDGKEKEMNVQVRNGDTGFVQLFEITMLAGRNLVPADSTRAHLINETFAHEMGYQNAADAVNKYIGLDQNKILIAGVMKDFNLTSSRSGVMPMVLRTSPRMYSSMQILLQPGINGSHKQAIVEIQKKFKKVYPNQEFTYKFFDETIEDFYVRERQLAKLLNWSTALSIFISGLGLLGLVIYTANQRQKEIGIRKVLGASLVQIVNLLSRDFLKLVALACIIAVPVAWWACSKWLEDFPFRAPLTAWVFLSGAAGLIIIAFIILSFKTIRSAAANPVHSLRSE
jgi:ABC-type antimicrobial peptide transport system permease subunit